MSFTQWAGVFGLVFAALMSNGETADQAFLQAFAICLPLLFGEVIG